MSGVPVEPVYGEAPYPGQFPYTRGLYASMYRSRLWTMRMFAGFGTANDTNARFKELLRSGGTGLSTAFDMPTLMGRDSDSEWAVGEVGRAGVAIDTLDDMCDLFADIELAIRDYARRAGEGTLTLEDLMGGTFTITNGGVFGSLMSTPILNPPQVGILGLHKIADRAVAVGGQVVIRPMMYLALSYDHRIVDGREAVTFLVRVKESLEDPTRLILEL